MALRTKSHDAGVKVSVLFVFVCIRDIAKVNVELQDLYMPSLIGYTCI